MDRMCAEFRSALRCAVAVRTHTVPVDPCEFPLRGPSEALPSRRSLAGLPDVG